MKMLPDKSCKSVEWYTPPEILVPVRAILGDPIPLDPCSPADDSNPTRAAQFLTPESRPDGLQAVWDAPAFVNPPYGRALYSWITKTTEAAALGTPVALLVAASSRWDQEGWQRLYTPELTCFHMPRGRVKYLSPTGERAKSPPYPSLLYFYNLPPASVAEHFAHLGTTVRQDVRGLRAYNPHLATPVPGPKSS